MLLMNGFQFNPWCWSRLRNPGPVVSEVLNWDRDTLLHRVELNFKYLTSATHFKFCSSKYKTNLEFRCAVSGSNCPIWASVMLISSYLVATFQTLLTCLFIAQTNENMPWEPQHLPWGAQGLKYPRRWETHFGVIVRIWLNYEGKYVP